MGPCPAAEGPVASGLGKADATHSGGVLLAPLPRECKCGFEAPTASGRGVLAGTQAKRRSAAKRHGHSDHAMRIALYQPDIPQNTGTILRLCACLGIEAHIIEPAGFPTSDRAFRRAGMDYLDTVAIIRHTAWLEFETWRQAQDSRVVLFTTAATLSYLDFRFRRGRRPPVRPRIGGRRAGGPRLGRCPPRSIPMRPGLRSLNVALAAAMAAGEALRQTGGMCIV